MHSTTNEGQVRAIAAPLTRPPLAHHHVICNKISHVHTTPSRTLAPSSDHARISSGHVRSVAMSINT